MWIYTKTMSILRTQNIRLFCMNFVTLSSWRCMQKYVLAIAWRPHTLNFFFRWDVILDINFERSFGFNHPLSELSSAKMPSVSIVVDFVLCSLIWLHLTYFACIYFWFAWLNGTNKKKIYDYIMNMLRRDVVKMVLCAAVAAMFACTKDMNCMREGS